MGIDVKETCAIIWKVIGFWMSTSIKFMRNHPILSLVSMFLLALYILLPSLLFFLIYSSPVLACVVVYAREKLGLRFSGSSSGPESCEGEKKGGRCHLRQQRSVRRNARMKVEEWDSQTSDEEKDKVILTSLYNDLLGRTPQFEESPKAIETNVVEEEKDKAFAEEDSRMSSQDLGYLNVEEEPMVCNCEVNEEKHDDKEETISNVNEHGISEVERNKRLESLIARRRTRRLFKLALDQHNKLQAEETTSPTQNNNLHITVPRNNNNNSFEKRRSYQSGLQVPGSAPSVMLQARSPFDIPYDPQEERPNLTGDSFDQEFSFFNPNDMFLCRHESFCRFAHFSPEHAQCMNSPVPASDISTTRKLLDLDNEYMDHNEQNIPCYVKPVTTKDDESGKNGDVEVNHETDTSEEDDDTSSCSEESEAELNRFNKAELREAISHSMDKFPGFLVNQARNDIPSPLPRGLLAPRLDDNNMFYARRGASSHNRTFSIASDMQVEVSELGSPPTTVDWLDDWSNGGESYTYDTDIDREIIRGEESRKSVSQQCESRSGTGTKEYDNGLVTKPYQKCLSDEHLRTADEMSLLDRRSQTRENFEMRPSRSSDVPKSRSYGKLDGLLFHTSVSLSSITEEPETILDSVDARNTENMNGLTKELTDQIFPTSTDSSMKNLVDEEVVDVQQLEHDDLCGPPKIMDSNIIDHQQKDQTSNIIQGEHDTEENAKPKEYEAAQSVLDASLTSPYVESFEIEIREEEPELDNSTKVVTQQREDEALQGDLMSSPKLQESAVMEENGQELVKNSDENVKPMEQEETHDVLDAFLIHPCTQLSEEYGNAKNDSDVILIQVQDGNNSTLDDSTDQQFSKEGESSGLLKDLHAESTQESNNIVNIEEESIGSEEAPNSQPWTQQQGTCSSQKPEHDEIISQDIAKDVEYENTKPMEYEADQSVLDSSLDTPCVDSFKREMKEEEEEDNFTKAVTEQTEDKALQGDLTSSHFLTNLQESEVMEENDPKLVKTSDKSAKLVEQGKTHDVLEASSSPPYTQLVEDYENAKNDCDVTLLKVQDGNHSTLDESTDQKFSNSGLLKDLHAEPTQEYNNIVNVKGELIGLEDAHDSQGSQPWTQQNGTDSSELISPRTLEITQRPEHDVSQDIAKDKVATEAKDSTDTEKNDEENLKHEHVIEEDVEKELLTLQSLHYNIGLTAREDDEESKKVVEAVHNSETKTSKTETDP
ncbi:hypothetical protein HID58_088252 [Brassica napus]|uniref:Uncharacterized protein n=2 Tax=Brassica TaxID=3705 RepID=A0ABQ7XY89_BRANA|nr:uncharacterized protein LOC106359115 [Brassica napus]KAH0859991.1 hypothetical protein HID58_088252 [Brassica napus]VDD32639.1 unnamed protein product [Brassica oleracea]